MTVEPNQPTIAEAENIRGSAEPNEVAPIEETKPVQPEIPVTESEIVNMPDAPVIENSEPKVIEIEPTPIVPETLPEAPQTLETAVESAPTEEPISTETPIESASETPTEEIPDIYTVRSNETGDKVYAVKDKKRYWIKNPETLAKMGFYLGKEKRIPFAELLGFAEGEPIDMTVPNAEYPWNKPEQPAPEPTNSTNIWQ